LSGFVFDAENDSLLEGVTVTTSYGFSTLSDTAGCWYLGRVLADTFNVTISKQGYNDSTLIDQYVEDGDTLEINIGLLHPELILSVVEINETIAPNSSVERMFTISDSGNGILEWSVQCRLPGESGVDPWEMRQSQVIGNTLEDSRLQGVVFIDDHYYVSGGGNDTNMIYVLDLGGDPVSSFPQFGESRYGMKDLAWDGELIWGVAEETVYGFNTDGDSITSFQGPSDRMAAIAWDPERELLWISELTSDIHGYDREGNHDQQHELSRQELRIYGLAYMPLDSTSLYIFNSPGDNRQVVHKMNPDIGDTIFVCELEPDSGGMPQGAFITDRYDDYGSWVFMDVVNDADNDRIDIWQLRPNTDWMVVEPVEGVIQPDSSQNLTLTLSTVGLDSTIDWQGELVFSQAVGGDDTHIPITMTISSSNAVADNGLAIPSEFGISSIYPNPFNSSAVITYSLPFTSQVFLQLFDLSGRRVATLFEDRKRSGIHTATLTANSLPSGLYFVRLKASGQVFTQKVMLIR
ncbi:T9SS type A sorting domain-containing protein, partial [bacterium]|nr:T9SS type A sorting domain-containing protein [bacterium]